MERLEACYFCGTAEEAPLREVSVTPRSRQGDPDAAVTLTLCRSCERKLERVLGGIFDHVESRPSTGEAGDDDRTETEADSAAGTAEAEPVDRIDPSSSEHDDEPRGRRDLFADPPEPAALGERSGADRTDGPGGQVDDAEIVEGEPVTATATINASKALEGVSLSEYDKVMRLLQNREFPVARGAFVDLAANAYDLAEGTVDAVLEAVIDQGALADRDGELVRPGEEGSA